MSRHRQLAVIVAILLGLLVTAPAPAATISFFANTTYADPFEAGNMRTTLVNLGHTVNDFTGITAADWTAAGAGGAIIVIPEMELANLNSDLTAAARAAILDYVTGGGCLIQANFFVDNSTLPNAVFGFGLVQSSNIGDTALDAGEAAGTAFAGGPAILPGSFTGANAVEGVLSASLPGGAENIYHDGTNTSVFVADVGAGHYIYLGYDWFEGSGVAAWNEVTGRAIEECGAAAVPEPGTVALLLTGFAASGVVCSIRRRRNRV
jgi:hypothetical protein